MKIKFLVSFALVFVINGGQKGIIEYGEENKDEQKIKYIKGLIEEGDEAATNFYALLFSKTKVKEENTKNNKVNK